MIDLSRLGLASKPRQKNDQQGGQHVPGGTSRRLPGQLQRVADLRLVQLPCRRQDVPAQHARPSSPWLRPVMAQHTRRSAASLPARWSIQAHGTSFLVASSSHPRGHARFSTNVLATSSQHLLRGCYEETALVEFRLYGARHSLPWLRPIAAQHARHSTHRKLE